MNKPLVRWGWANHDELYAQLPMKRNSHLPDEGFDPIEVTLHEDGRKFWVSCLPKHFTKRRNHRVLVHCSCDRLIPFGRMCQHFPTHKQ